MSNGEFHWYLVKADWIQESLWVSCLDQRVPVCRKTESSSPWGRQIGSKGPREWAKSTQAFLWVDGMDSEPLGRGQIGSKSPCGYVDWIQRSIEVGRLDPGDCLELGDCLGLLE